VTDAKPVRGSVFTIDISEVRKLAYDICKGAAQKFVIEELVTAGQRSGIHARNKANALIKNQSNALKNSAEINTRLRRDDITTVVEWKATHAKWVDRGRKAFAVKKAKALRFEIDGEVLYRHSVGPAKAQNFTGRGLQAAEALIIAEHQRAADRIGTRLEGM
jgi:hypothetical protein